MDSTIQIKAGSTSQTVLFTSQCSYAAGHDITYYAVRARENMTYANCAALSAPNASWVSGAFGLAGNPGAGQKTLRFDIPNALLAAGSRQLTLTFYDSNLGVSIGTIMLEITETENQAGETYIVDAYYEANGSTGFYDIVAKVVDTKGSPITNYPPLLRMRDGTTVSMSHTANGIYKGSTGKATAGSSGSEAVPESALQHSTTPPTGARPANPRQVPPMLRP